jgi:hypothetical protein
MSICGTPLIHRPIPAQESIFRAELAQLPLPERARRIDLKLRETREFLGAIAAPLRQIARARQVAAVLGQEQEPFWLTAENVALSNLGITPPAEVKWWWKDHVVFVFVRHIAVRFSVDATTERRLGSEWFRAALRRRVGWILNSCPTASISTCFHWAPKRFVQAYEIF